jgi:hypothetical protein
MTKKIFFLVILCSFMFVFFACSKSQPNTTPETPEPVRLLERIKEEKVCRHKTPEKFAILISGGGEERYMENLSLAYQILLENGFKRKNIYILDCDGKYIAYYPADSYASKNTMTILFEHLAKRITSKDLLFVYATDHGDREQKDFKLNGKEKIEEVSVLHMDNGDNVDEYEFAHLVESLKFKMGIFLFDQCYSGGFAERLAGKNRIAISACKKNEASQINSFPLAFFSAFRENSADSDGDGKISIGEAFNFAKQNDQAVKDKRQTPQIIDGVGRLTF